ncbi:hypothetical protein [Bacillus sp. ISL-55]|uniref:hypothetical protein n=1 Tax=Bacillus sp. ISL-55 TaxID=2819134 RepID=UPI001BE939A6|nr:hypothetical protein [Bacillus sp. ISL-55]MBT2691655.1 hypothetical protein [Bacillus sp. ISL-55]
MKYFKLISVFILAFLFGAVFTTFPTVSHACKCVEPQSVEKELESSEAVFSGKIIDIRTEKNSRKILFEVEETWKGVSQTQIFLKDERSSCSLDFFKGESYLVYAYDFQDELTTNICDRTKELSGAGEDLAALGKGTMPTEEADLKNQLRNPVVRYSYIWLPLVSLLIVAAILIRKRPGN